jgi:hypothetical protein
MAARIQADVPVPLVDSVSAGACLALELARQAADVPTPAATAAAIAAPAWQGLSSELVRCLAPIRT